MKNEKMYIVEGMEWFQLLQKHGYHWGNHDGDLVGSGTPSECGLDDSLCACAVIDTTNKVVSWFPLEIYQSSSPTANKEKFDYYMSKCLSNEELIKNIKDTHNIEE